VREQPSFEDITLYQLCYWKVTRIYGLTPEEIEDLLTNPEPHIPSHHPVDPRIIKAYLTGESIPTIFHDIGCHVILESTQRIFLGIDSFLVNWQYLWSTHIIARIIIYGNEDWMQI
jgi:hypothetical protein